MSAKSYTFFILLSVFTSFLQAQTKILFDATKAEAAANADWVIDADLHNLGYGTGPAVVGGGNESNPQQMPNPAQSGITQSTVETYWQGGISSWGIDLVKKGYWVETLPYNGQISYGNAANAQDLTNYKVFIVCEPNIIFSTAEKTALMQFVQNGGGLFMVSDHDASDRNNDGNDSPHIWNDFMTNNGVMSNPFGMIFDYVSFSQTTTNIPNLPADPLLHGVMGDVTQAMWSAGTSITLSPANNSSILGVVYKTGSSFGNTNAMVAYATYGNGKVVGIGDSSPCDDGSGDSGDVLYDGWIADAGGNHRKLIINATIWLASSDIVIPTITTTAATSITVSSASSGGSVTADGGATVTERGVCWATTASPVTTGNHTTDGTGTGVFTSSITGLTAGTLYHIRAYATNTAGTAYGSDLQFTTLAILPTVTTTTPTSILSTTASSGGNVTTIGGSAVTARGVCWSTTANPDITASHTTDGSGSGVFTSSISGLTAGTLYHVRAYATNSGGTAYGSDLQFTTLAALPTVTTTTPSSILSTTASSGGNVTAIGGSAVTARGVCWSTTTNPDITASHTTDGSGSGVFASSITGLTPGTLYHIRAYATNTGGTAYGSDLQFTTLAALPTVTTTTPTSILSISASSGGTVTADGGATVTARGVCWATTASPVATGNHSADGAGIGVFTSSITGLTAGTLYHVRAYATNSVGTNYGSDLQFTTLALPTLSVTPSNQNVTAVAGTTSFAVTSNSSWTAGSDQGWCTVTLSGTGNGTITANYTENTSVTPRVANVTVTLAGLTPIVVTVSQAGATPTLIVTPPDQPVTSAAGSTSFSVTSNTGWTAGSNQSWCTVTLSGTGNGTITANYTENTTFVVRVANVTVTVTGITPVVVTVTQAAAPLPEFLFTIENDVQTSDRIMEFDLYLLNTNASSPLELATVQAGVLVNPGIYGGGTITLSIVPNSSELVAASRPTTVLWVQSQNCIKLVPKTPPGAGSGTIISATAPGTRVCRLRITNTLPFTASSTANLAFNFLTTPYPTKVFKYVGITNVQVTCNVVNCYNNASNIILNAPNKVLNLSSVFLEGLYSGAGTMHAAADESGAHWGATIADKITVELHDNSNYANVMFTSPTVELSTSGAATLNVPNSYSGNYYITIKHRNSIETVSALPVSFTGSTINYAFDNATKAFGSNLLLMIDGGWVIYGGDVNQDGIIDSGDMAPIDNLSTLAASGYLVEDANGDGLVDAGDMAIVDNNSAAAVSIAVP